MNNLETSPICIVIVNHNSARLTIACVASLKQHHPKLSLHFIVLDNSATSEANQILASDQSLQIIRLEHNLGFAAATNQGVNIAAQLGFKICLLLNPDTYCDCPFIARLVNALSSNTKIAAVSPYIFTSDKAGWYLGGTISLLKGGPRHLLQPKQLYQDCLFVAQEFVSCCCLLIDIEKFLTVKGLPEVYFLYFEDAELSCTLRNAGYQIGIAPKAHIYHHVSASTNPSSTNYVRLFARNRIWFMYRNYSKLQFIIFMLINTFIRLPTALIYFFLFKHSLSMTKAYIIGYLEGILLNYKNRRTRSTSL